MESARCPQPRIPSPTMSAASKGEERLSAANKETPKVQEIADETMPIAVSQQTEEKMKTAKLVAMSEATRESASVKEPASQGSAPPVEEEVQQKVVSIEAGIMILLFNISLAASVDLQKSSVAFCVCVCVF